MKVSVVMATYNGMPFIKAQIESLKGQARLPDELVVSDDGSSDRTLELAREILGNAPFSVCFTSNPGSRGYSANFVHATQKSTGDLIFFCDQDDIWAPNKIDFMERAFKQNVLADCMVHDFSIANRSGPTIPSYFRYLRENGAEPHTCIKGCATVIRRSLLESEGWLISGGWAYDMWVNGISALLRRRVVVPEVLMEHSIHGANTSGYVSASASRTLKGLRGARRHIFPGTVRNETVVCKRLSLDQLNALDVHLRNRGAERLRDDLSYVRDFIKRRRPLLEFRSDPSYRRAVNRLVKSLEYAWAGAYVTDEVFTFLYDLLGRNADDQSSGQMSAMS